MKKEKITRGIIANVQQKTNNIQDLPFSSTLRQKLKLISEQFKGQVDDKEVKYPKNIGVQHPFDFKIAQDLYNSFGYVTGAIDKHVDSIVGDFTVGAKDNNVQALIDSFVSENNFQVTLRDWVRSALITGNGFLEIDLQNSRVRVLDPNQMYVKRDNKGVVKSYTQVVGNNNGFTSNGKIETVEFTPNQIAHLKIKAMPGAAYGMGIISQAFKTLDMLIQNQNDMHKMVSRKAGQPYHVKAGIQGEATSQEDLDALQAKLDYMNTRTEWVTDANIEIKTVDFGKVEQGFMGTLDYDLDMLVYSFQVPIVLMGRGNIPEGLAKVQLETFQRRIRSFQEDIERVLEDNVFTPYLQFNSFQERVEVTWNLPGEDEINAKIEKLTNLLSNSNPISENMRRMIELQLAELMEIPDAEKYLAKPDVSLMDMMSNQPQDNPQDQQNEPDNNADDNPERQAEQNIKQPEVPGAKPSANQSLKEDKPMTILEWVNVVEFPGFNYNEYLAKVISATKRDKFEQLLAKTARDVELGLFPQSEIDKLREILKNGFINNKTINEIEKDIAQNISIKDRFRIDNEGNKVLAIEASNRPINIARTETVRLSNKGLVEEFKSNQITKVQFLAALSDRTCPICSSLNGRIFEINQLNEGANQPPIHSMCRCSLVPVIEGI